MSIYKKELRKILFSNELNQLNNRDFLEFCNNYTNKQTNIWINSKYTDFSIYNDKDYLLDLFLCYSKTSHRATIETIKFLKSIGFCNKKILDDYCGCGLTSIHLLKEGYKVDCFIDSSIQLESFKKLVNFYKLNNYKIVSNRNKKYDCILSFEICEHYQQPIEYLKEITESLNLDGLLSFTSTFNKMCIGHFEEYLINSEYMVSKEAGKKIREFLNSYYKLLYRGFNSIPKIYKKK
jgi:2-polyprenyl-3-methyl-5-hydroxy-6-metoxy-1,4-benzoquinol methylase